MKDSPLATRRLHRGQVKEGGRGGGVVVSLQRSLPFISLPLSLRLPALKKKQKKTNSERRQRRSRLSGCLADMPTASCGGLMRLLSSSQVSDRSVCPWHECVKRIAELALFPACVLNRMSLWIVRACFFLFFFFFFF